MSGDSTSIETLNRSLLKLQEDTKDQELSLQKLKKVHAELEKEIKTKISDILIFQQEERQIEGQIQCCAAQLKNQEEMNAKDDDIKAKNCEIEQNLNNDLDGAVGVKLQWVEEYDVQMQELALKIKAAPHMYKSDTVKEDITVIRSEREKVHQELSKIQQEIDEIRKKYTQKGQEANDFTKTVKNIILQLNEETEDTEAESTRLNRKLQKLQAQSNDLKEELELLKGN